MNSPSQKPPARSSLIGLKRSIRNENDENVSPNLLSQNMAINQETSYSAIGSKRINRTHDGESIVFKLTDVAQRQSISATPLSNGFSLHQAGRLWQQYVVDAVKNYMIHESCGKDCTYSPCMVRGKCHRHFPKRYNEHTFFDDSGFPVYRRRRTENFIKKKGVSLDNQYVIPYNRDLLIRFHSHINLEICNSSTSLKYLLKYCLKGHDTATMLLKKRFKFTYWRFKK
ncbi:uncharacterized protein LOC141689804 isoform X2 [Apium graveolens]|uniref:uncharacterized protein LOC141689804 isoform X2 n=1 Tax=Apium graveolens TaxID=4045 RepID=UPI003D78C7E3